MSWPIVTLGELALSVRNGMFASRPTDEPPGTRILRISAVRDGRVNNADSKFVANLMSDQIEKFSVRPGDLLVTRYNGSRSLVGISGIVPPHEDPIVYPDKLIRIVVDRSLADPRFVNYQFQSSHVRAYLEPRIRTTAGQSGINGADLRSVPLALPPCEEQRRIVDLLEDHLSRLDAARRWVGQARIKLDALVRSSQEAQLSGDNVVPLPELIDVRPGPSRSPNTHPVTTPPGGDRSDTRCATTASLQRRRGGSYGPTRRSPRPSRLATSAWPTSDLGISRPARRPGRPPHRNCGPAQPAVGVRYRRPRTSRRPV